MLAVSIKVVVARTLACARTNPRGGFCGTRSLRYKREEATSILARGANAQITCVERDVDYSRRKCSVSASDESVGGSLCRGSTIGGLAWDRERAPCPLRAAMSSCPSRCHSRQTGGLAGEPDGPERRLATPDSRFVAQRPSGTRKGSIKGFRLRGA